MRLKALWLAPDEKSARITILFFLRNTLAPSYFEPDTLTLFLPKHVKPFTPSILLSNSIKRLISVVFFEIAIFIIAASFSV